MSSTSLRVYPATPDAVPEDLADFFTVLQTVGLIDPATVYSITRTYSPGPRFYELIVFRTSHPVMQLANAGNQIRELGLVDSRGLCRIAFSEVYPEPAFLGMGNTCPPRCPACGRMVANWQQAMDTWFENKAGYRWHCGFCESEVGPAAWDWQHSAAIACFTLDIPRIRPREVYPSAQLLRFLSDYLGSQWDY